MERSSIPTREAGGLYEGLSDLDKKNFWALESFTTYYIPLLEFPDARRAQYHLRVNAIAWYRYDQWQRNVFAPFFQFNQYDSGWQSKWTQSEVRPLPFAFIFFRARAGTGVWPYFFLRPFPGGEFSYGTGYPNVVFWVRGEHFYKDGNSTNPLPVPFGYSRAYNDCNLSQWGWFWETP